MSAGNEKASASPAQDSVALLYSGGADSSLAACRLARRFKTVYLNTFTRFGFMAEGFSGVHFERMRQRFPGTRFVHNFIPASQLYSEVESYRYWGSFRKYGPLVLNSCGHCKTALHWRNLVFCLQNGVKHAADGAVVGAEEFAEQNPRILMPELKRFYGDFGVELLHPVYEEGLSTEQALYELGITDYPEIKLTRHDMQVVCSQQIMFAMMMRVYLRKRTFAEYEKQAREYLSEKLRYMTELTKEYEAAREGGGRLARLLS